MQKLYSGGNLAIEDPYDQTNMPLSEEQLHMCGASENLKKFYFEPDMLTIVKKCKEFEVDVYECIFNTERLPKDMVDEEWRIFYHGLR